MTGRASSPGERERVKREMGNQLVSAGKKDGRRESMLIMFFLDSFFLFLWNGYG